MINMIEAPPTQRLQLALNVTNLEESIAFYTKLFGTEPARLRPGYANFAIANPPLKLVLFEGTEDGSESDCPLLSLSALPAKECRFNLF